MTGGYTSARRSGLIACHDCGLLVPAGAAGHGHARCPRCGAALHGRKPDSLARAWAFLLAAAIMYVPASWEIAAVIFIASIFVPMAKLAILVFLLLSVQLRCRWRPRDRTVLYRMTELVGRWSMVDVYVVTILVALVKLGAVANIEAGPAAVFFATVVVLTMLAAESFDPRLIWDVIEEDS
jgi:paraquat-inducible protein A